MTLKGKKTFLGVFMLLVPVIMKSTLDVEVSETELALIVEQFSTLFGSVLAIYGRIDANK